MKKIISGSFFLFFVNVFSQNYVTMYYNPEFHAQVTSNHGMRIASENLLRNRYESIKDKYEEINQKAAQILVIRQQLHSYLTNVHSLIANGQQLKRIYTDLQQLFNHLGEMSQLAGQYPEYVVFCTPTFNKAYIKAIECQQYITSIILKEDPKYLIDMHNRTLFLAKVQGEIRDLNLLVYSVVLYIKNAKSIPYWRHIPNMDLYYTMDKELIKQILQQASWL
ncbi:hypothetical protein NZD88_20745 [Chryseobacterium antibioticum]|uniref:Uncharacterized protein n=1 Tax=Chryseobacterium pyrolae TaxID=2987481 RepID=A0ABT2IMV1_9FLAO|nr:hypothetical protein [Chryseobacterium pyrolae]MCT2409991.1 hypothetical protein [Chryseobacterium pyrolae]